MHYLLLFCVVTIYMVKKTTRHGKELVSEALQDCRLGEKAHPVQKFLLRLLGLQLYIDTISTHSDSFFTKTDYVL